MLKVLFAFLFLIQDAPIAITSPLTGETLHGQVGITGNMNVTSFASAELDFSYASDPASTWFTLQTFSSPVPDQVIATWDTTRLTDGDYVLRLRVTFLDGSTQEVLVTGLKIQNDMPTPTLTLTLEPESTSPTPLPTSTVIPAPVLPAYPTPTPLPVNPAALTVPSVYSNFARGTIVTLALFALVGILLRLRAGK